MDSERKKEKPLWLPPLSFIHFSLSRPPPFLSLSLLSLSLTLAHCLCVRQQCCWKPVLFTARQTEEGRVCTPLVCDAWVLAGAVRGWMQFQVTGVCV
ncbi:hypothetical protein DNTS_016390 [Danionella cerebrum]|uniref:Uncharacterized protein n=1 Tax=Danionella cerebrum TaxID=2873325 RepID=A0A553R5Z0_9TELE|nr:hypothetical protein DNTS_016390 [Danionella translucida]